MRIAVVMPTITGREESCARMVGLYFERTPGHHLEVVTPKDFTSWPAGCNRWPDLVPDADVLHFTADDIEPLDGWAEAMLAALSAGEVPAPRIWDWTVSDGPAVNEHQDGGPGAVPEFSRIPSLTREMAERIGPWPEAIHYYSDNWVSDKARLLGYGVRVMEAYRFVHHWHPVGRLDHGDWVSRSIGRYNEERAKLGLPPVGR